MVTRNFLTYGNLHLEKNLDSSLLVEYKNPIDLDNSFNFKLVDCRPVFYIVSTVCLYAFNRLVVNLYYEGAKLLNRSRSGQVEKSE
jgi:hypothetical protein